MIIPLIKRPANDNLKEKLKHLDRESLQAMKDLLLSTYQEEKNA